MTTMMNDNTDRLAMALVGRTRINEIRRVALAELEDQHPGSRWSILERLGPGHYHATSSDGISLVANHSLAKLGFHALPVFWDAQPGLLPQWGTGEARADEPEIILGAWNSPLLDAEFFLRSSRLIGRACAAAREVEALRRDTARDPLTGAASRRAILDALEREKRRSQRYQRPLSVLYADLDGFKEINDIHGHAAGDIALGEVANLLSDAVRASDLVGRVGGDEFLVLLPETPLDQARLVANRICDHVASAKIKHGSNEITLGISLGVACTAEAATHNLDLVDLADKRMLQNKSRTRRRTAKLIRLPILQTLRRAVGA